MIEATRCTLTIAVCTYDRTDLLRQSLASLVALSDAVSREILVVDNADEEGGSATTKAVVDEFGERASVPVRYIAARGPNISLARNVAIEATNGEILAFVDDDMLAPDGWADVVVEVMESTKADAFLGNVLPQLLPGGEPLPDLDLIYTRRLSLPEGGRVWPTRYGHYKNARSANSAFRMATTFDRGLRFDPAFGTTGGEDTDIFAALYPFDPVVTYSLRGWMWELIPPERQKEDYLMRRCFRGSQVFVRAMVKHSKRPLLTGLKHRLIGVVQWLSATLKPARSDAAAFHKRIAKSLAVGKIHWDAADPLRHYH